MLSEHGCSIAPSTYYAFNNLVECARSVRDAELKDLITTTYEDNFRVYGARKIWRELNRRGHAVARCTVERLMRDLGITGAVRGRRVVTTVPDPSAERAPDLVDRDFVAPAPNRCWVADFTHVAAFAGVVYVAFVVDTFSRRIVGWSAATTKRTRLVLDALEMALWQRDRDGCPPRRGELIHHSDAGSQYTSFRLAEHLDAAGIAASIGSVGDAYDNALMESTIGLFKTELIKPRRPWRTLAGCARRDGPGQRRGWCGTRPAGSGCVCGTGGGRWMRTPTSRWNTWICAGFPKRRRRSGGGRGWCGGGRGWGGGLRGWGLGLGRCSGRCVRGGVPVVGSGAAVGAGAGVAGAVAHRGGCCGWRAPEQRTRRTRRRHGLLSGPMNSSESGAVAGRGVVHGWYCW